MEAIANTESEEYEIYLSRDKLTDFQRSKFINLLDIVTAEHLFGIHVADHLDRDYRTRYTLWDSCSMIAQSWSDFQSHKPLSDFNLWFFSRLNIISYGEYKVGQSGI